ncbi:MAG: C-GCAxxG-C-C family (seleno)protein [Bacteroidota bacterium]
MKNTTMDRKTFLANGAKIAVGSAVGVAGLNMLTSDTLKANPSVVAWPWPYTALDAEAARLLAHHLYWTDKDCASGVFGALVQLLAEKTPDPWAGLPIEVMLFGRGGGNGWGTLCGAVNGAAAVISLVATKADSGKLINEVWGWSASEKFPTDAANQASIDGKYVDKKFNGALPQSISGSVICHSSVSQWCNIAVKKVSDVERKERCARLAGDLAAKTVQVLNAHFAATFTPTYVRDAYAAQCLSCHGTTAKNNVMTEMNCQPCHGDPHASPSPVVEQNELAVREFGLEQNFPNPFNPSTKIQFSLPEQQRVAIEIYDIKGQLVKKLVDHEMLSAGTFTTEWNGKDAFGGSVSSGTYFARMTSDKYMQTIKLNLLK